MSRQFPAVAGTAAVLAAGLLIGWNPPPSAAQQSPGTWSGEQRAVLPSGLSVHLDFAASPGAAVIAEPGELADRAGGGRSAALYTDGVRPGDPAQTFRISENRPQTDGSWRTVGTLRLTFSRAVRNPRLHVSGLAVVATGKSGSTSTAARLTLTGGSPGGPTLVNRTDWPGWTADGNVLAPAGADGTSDGTAGSAAEGSLELAGTFTSAVFRVEQRTTARAGSTTAPLPLTLASTVTLDEGVGTAPQGYGNASHLLSDLYLGGDAAQAARADRQPARLFRRPDAGRAGEPTGEPTAPAGESQVRTGRGEEDRSVRSSPPPPQLQPGRGEYQGADPAVSYPAEAAIGRYYRLAVPVAVGDAPATLAGWIDFDRNGRFDPVERVQAEAAAGERSVTLEWTVPGKAASGETWARLRIGRDATQLVEPGGFADSGQVADQRIRLTVGASRPEIAEPVDGTAVTETRPRISGDGAVAGATVEIREGDTVICRTKVARGGGWSCRPDTALSGGAHSLTPVETTGGGLVLRGEPVRITVRSAPPAVPLLSLPEFTNDPGLQLTGTGEPGSTVTITDQPADGHAADAADLCSTAVRSDGGWSCLPVENLADGRHRLTPAAADLAGNRTAGKAVTLVVDTVSPDRPVLTEPSTGETLRTARPRLAGKAEPEARVIVTARAGSEASTERIVACGATAAIDGSWICTANRDLPDGDQWLVVTATDRAGNGTAGDAVAVRVEAAAVQPPTVPVPTATPTATVAPTAAPTGAATATPTVAPTVGSTAVPAGGPTTVPPQVPAVPAVPAVSPGAETSASASPSAAVPAVVPSAAASTAVAAPVSPTPVVSTASGTASAAVPTVGTPASGTPSASRSAAASPSVAVPSPSAPAAPSTPVGSASAVASPGVPSPSAPAPSGPAGSPPAAPSAASPEPVPDLVFDPVPPGLLPIVVPPVTGVAVRPVTPSPTAPATAVPPTAAGATGTARTSPTAGPSPTAPRPSSSPASPTSPTSPSAGLSPSPSLSLSQVPSPSPSSLSSPLPSPSQVASQAPSPGPSSPSSPIPDVIPAPADTPSAPATASAPAAGAAVARSAGQAATGADTTAEAGRALAAPPAPPAPEQQPSAEAGGSPVASDRHRSDGWRGALAGVLLVLTGIGLITRRVLVRGSGTRRR
ncbi:Ig-like domain-containing protein [Streptomyces sp. BE20]|uniref:Ig-like domain-containing protein n=1 Tax=Streptomyces sp. BE20 TaxID=3002525 RepID=UPI002E79752F|nr:Ig-like domain-containing protein [Streptomyces sp. BE20]MEE1828430.1 Ig-like domain-containing protein [Streptomyces sp. BE20]